MSSDLKHQKHQFVIKTSLIPNAGKGVFYEGEKPIEKGQKLLEYEGIILGGDKERGFRSDRSVDIGDGYEIYGTGIASFINDGLSYFNNNCIFSQEFGIGKHSKIFICSTKIINPGDELFVPYGDEFWKVRMNNIKNLPN